MNIALILAAGRGTRMGSPMPKQFIQYKNKPILVYTLEAFANNGEIDEICVLCPEDCIDFTQNIVNKYQIPKVAWIAAGGMTRRESSQIGVFKLMHSHEENDIVLIHDGARPNVSDRIISENIAVARAKGACETVIRSHDTIAVSMDGCKIHRIPNREVLYHVQTPQSFRLGLIHEAHAAYESAEDVTDDAALILQNGGDVFLVEGDKLNIKITTEEDLRILYSIME